MKKREDGLRDVWGTSKKINQSQREERGRRGRKLFRIIILSPNCPSLGKDMGM
jgi:hypothetical protein